MSPADRAATFRALHHDAAPLILPNVWDPVSAQSFAEAGFPAVATSSAALALALGYTDGEYTPLDTLFAALARITRVVDVPVTADVERGFQLPPAELVERLLEAGVVGCNLEDSDPRTKELVDPEEQADLLAAVREAAGDRLFVNARIDTYVREYEGDALAGAVERGRRYVAAGADGLYPFGAPPAELAELATEFAPAPVNAVCLPGRPSLDRLVAAGARRVTFAAGLFQHVTGELAGLAARLRSDGPPWEGEPS